MDRRLFLKDLGLLGLGALLLPKGRSMVGWTRSLESGIYLRKEYAAHYIISREMLEDTWWVEHTLNKMNDPKSIVADMTWQQIAERNKVLHGVTSSAHYVVGKSGDIWHVEKPTILSIHEEGSPVRIITGERL